MAVPRSRRKEGRRQTKPSAQPRLSFRAVDRSTWTDFERLFEARGSPKSCWCLVWRATPEEARHPDRASRKEAMRRRVKAGVPVGILAYRDGQPVAWCSIAPRATYRRLGGPDADPAQEIWSLACFFVVRPLRSQGIVRLLIREAEAYARSNGATILEAYPVDPESPSYRFMGYVESFRAAGYREVGRAGSRRHVYRKTLAG